MKRLKQLIEENGNLKRLVADLFLDIYMATKILAVCVIEILVMTDSPKLVEGSLGSGHD